MKHNRQVGLIVLIGSFFSTKMATSPWNISQTRDLLLIYGEDLATKVKVDNCVGCHDFDNTLPRSTTNSPIGQNSSKSNYEDLESDKLPEPCLIACDSSFISSSLSLETSTGTVIQNQNNPTAKNITKKQSDSQLNKSSKKSYINDGWDSLYFQSFSDSSIVDNIQDYSDWSFRKYFSRVNVADQLSSFNPEPYDSSYLVNLLSFSSEENFPKSFSLSTNSYIENPKLQKRHIHEIEPNKHEVADEIIQSTEPVVEWILSNRDSARRTSRLIKEKFTLNNQAERTIRHSFARKMYSERNDQPSLFDYVAENNLGKDKIVLPLSEMDIKFIIPTHSETSFPILFESVNDEAVVTVLCSFENATVSVMFQQRIVAVLYSDQLPQNKSRYNSLDGTKIYYRWTSHGSNSALLNIKVKTKGGQISCAAKSIHVKQNDCSCGMPPALKRPPEFVNKLQKVEFINSENNEEHDESQLLDSEIKKNNNKITSSNKYEHVKNRYIDFMSGLHINAGDNSSDTFVKHNNNDNNSADIATSISGAKTRIIGGALVEGDESGWHASLMYLDLYRKIHFCGATVISSKWVLTAAHCLSPFPFRRKSRLRVFAGSNNLSKLRRNLYKVSRIFVHPDFKDVEDDIALIKIRGRFYNPKLRGKSPVSPICLPGASQYPSPLAATVAGWGQVQNEGVTSRHLLKTTVHTMSTESCKILYSESKNNTSYEQEEDIHWRKKAFKLNYVQEEPKLNKDNRYNSKNIYATNLSNSTFSSILDSLKQEYPEVNEILGHETHYNTVELPTNFLKSLQQYPQVPNKSLCASNFHTVGDACQGDSGGALYAEDPRGFLVQLGVVSWGVGCGDPHMPGVYTRTADYMSWIRITTNLTTPCCF